MGDAKTPEKARVRGPRGVPRLVVSVHDVAPATAGQTRRWCADADSLGIPVSLLVIPVVFTFVDDAVEAVKRRLLRQFPAKQ